MIPLAAYVLLFVAVGAGFIFVHLMAGKLIRPSKPSAEKGTIYECGEPTIGSAWVQFDLRFYVVALLFVIALIGLAMLAPLYALESWLVAAPRLSWGSLGGVLYIACFASIGAYLCWNRGVELVGPNNAGFTIHLLPAFGTLLAVVVLQEEVHAFHAVGIATILFGVWLATSARRR